MSARPSSSRSSSSRTWSWVYRPSVYQSQFGQFSARFQHSSGASDQSIGWTSSEEQSGHTCSPRVAWFWSPHRTTSMLRPLGSTMRRTEGCSGC